MTANTDISGSFKVASWLNSVDTKNREQLLKSCQDWNPEHTKLLLQEISAILSGSSLLNTELVRTDNSKLLYAASMLSKNIDFYAAPIAVGLVLIA